MQTESAADGFVAWSSAWPYVQRNVERRTIINGEGVTSATGGERNSCFDFPCIKGVQVDALIVGA